MGEQISNARSVGSNSSPLINPAEGIGMEWAQFAFPIVGQEFSFISCDIYVNRAVSFASFAGETQIEGFLDALIAPAVFDDVAMQHFPEQVSAAAGGVPFLASDHVTGAHGVLLAFTAPATAFAYSYATEGSLSKAAVVLRKIEMRLRFWCSVAGPEPEIFVNAIWIHDLPRVHFPIRVPDGLELAKCFHQLGPKHLVKKLGARLAVAMFAGKRTAVPHDQIGCLFHERPKFLNASRRFEIESHTAVNAALSKVPVEGGLVVIFRIKPEKVAKVCTHLCGRNGRIFPSFPCMGFTRNERVCAERELANAPDFFLLGGIYEHPHVRWILVLV